MTDSAKKSTGKSAGNTLSAGDVREFLLANPRFLLDEGDLIEALEVPTNLPSGVVSFTQYQAQHFRQRASENQERLADFHIAAEQNEALWEQLYGWTLVLLKHLPLPTDARAEATILTTLDAHFRIDWMRFCDHAAIATALFADEKDPARELQHRFALSRVFCLVDPAPALGTLLRDDDTAVRSCAVIDVSDGQRGKRALLLGAANPERFSPDLGTRFLERIGDLTAGALAVTPAAAEAEDGSER